VLGYLAVKVKLLPPFKTTTMECNKCKINKPINEFPLNGKKYTNGEPKYRGECKQCYKSDWRIRLLSGLSSRACHSRKRPNGTIIKAKQKDKDINKKFLDYLLEKQNGNCYWLNIPLDLTMKDALRKPSLDRLDNSKGYSIDNVVLTTVFANTGRRDATINEFKYFLNTYLWNATN
jgi:hypothetical protein